MTAPLPYWHRGQHRRDDETPEDHAARLDGSARISARSAGRTPRRVPRVCAMARVRSQDRDSRPQARGATVEWVGFRG